MTIELDSHKITGLNEVLCVKALDEPGVGKAYHEYVIHADESKIELAQGVTVWDTISFQNGAIQESGVNGVSNEALLAIVEHRLQCFQESEFRCRENAVALTKIQEAMMWLQKRTIDRTKRGVEGTHKV